MRKYSSIFGAKKEKQPAAKPSTKTKEEKKKQPKKQEQQPVVAPKKRGRPSNVELAVKAREKREAETALRKELLERQQAAASGSLTPSQEPAPVEYDENDERVYPVYKTDFSNKVKDPNWIPPWPIFMPNQRVYTEMYGIRYEGSVGLDNVESAFIRVNWDDGSSQFAAKMNLKPIVKKQKKVYKSLLRAPRKKKEQ